MKVAIGIPTYNGAGRVDNLLKSISMRTDLADAKIVLVDDGSPNVEDTRRVARDWMTRLPLVFIEHGVNRGIAAGWNTASRATGAETVVLINDDVIVSNGWLPPILHVLDRSPLVGVVGQSWHAFLPEDAGALLASPDSDRDVIPRDPVTKAHAPERRISAEDTNPGRVMCPTGQLFGFRRADFDAIGGFDEAYKAFYDESDFGTAMAAKLGKIGCQIAWPFIYHLWSATYGANPELNPSERMAASRAHYRQKWRVPEGIHEFEHTNPKYMGAIGDVPIEFVRKSGAIGRGVLRRDGAFIEEL